MKVQLRKHWDRLRSSFWFLPAIMAAGSVLLATASVALDRAIPGGSLDGMRWVYTGGAEGASAVLGTIAGSMMTIAGVVFSMTLVALSLASSQFGPRLLRTFMRDTMNQFVLGAFVATFLYCLLVLRTIRRADEIAFVPHLSVTLGVVLAVASVGVLIAFIHHIAISVQTDEIVARVGKELNSAVDTLFPETLGHEPPAPPALLPARELLTALDRDGQDMAAAGDGYVQAIDQDRLIALATAAGIVVRVERPPGSYVVAGQPLVRVWPGNRLTEELAGEINAAFVVGTIRTAVQDVAFLVDQLVEIAVRALSPGVNDPFTAIRCIDRLGSALCRLARREIPSPYRFDEHDQLRVIAPGVTFPALLDAAFNQIREYGGGSVAVTTRLLETVAVIAACVCRPEDRDALRRHAVMIIRGARERLPEREDRRTVDERYEAAARLLREALEVGPIDSGQRAR
jgi:uncharacterized membrane protein